MGQGMNFTAVSAFMKNYWRRYRVLVIALSVIVVVFFYGAVIPASVATATGDIAVLPKLVGGVEVSRGEINSAYDLSIPRNEAGERLELVGTFKVTHYCACTVCTYGTGITATGKQVAEGMVASDWNVLPPHTVVYVKRGDSVQKYVVEDRGGAIRENRLDIYVPSHDQALRAGVFNAEVYVDPGALS